MFLNGLIATVVNHPTMLHATSAVMKQRQNQPTYEEAVDHWNRRASFDIHNADEGEKGLYSDPI